MKKHKELKENAWTAAQARAAEASGLAIVVKGEDSSVLAETNNNSMCRLLYASEQFAPECDKYCGKAFDWAADAGKTVAYRCYAGLDCRAVPVKIRNETKFVAIVGRAFTKAGNYRNATARAISGDWKIFAPDEFFENVLLTGSPNDLETAAETFQNVGEEEKNALLEIAGQLRNAESGEDKSVEAQQNRAEISNENADENGAAGKAAEISNRFARRNTAEAEEIAAWRSLFGSLLNLTYKRACVSIMQFLSERYALKSLAWLERHENDFETIFAVGKFKDRQMQFGIAADDARLSGAARTEISLELRERIDEETSRETETIRLFPIAVGGEIRSGLILDDGEADENKRRHIARFCRTIAPELEILRLREELSKRGWLEGAVRKFNENLRKIDSEDFWLALTQIFAELMKSERASLLVFDEKSASFTAKSAIGITAERIKNETETLGERVAAGVFGEGKPVVVQNVEKIGIRAAPVDWKYKSKSFISYPIEIGGRKIGVLNLTEKAGGEVYNQFDLDLLRAIVPQMAVLIDRAALKHKAGEFEQLSVTDALTGLLNRRYLEERLTEEIKRSNRYGFPMSFMMIDVDDFKSYNDKFLHTEGDKALKLVAQHLKETLRGADIAARYGGEEFSILLPQTTAAEAAIIAERIRERVDAAQFPNRKVTVSLGVATCSHIVCNSQEIIKAADKALYEAKRQGKNNVQIYEKLT